MSTLRYFAFLTVTAILTTSAAKAAEETIHFREGGGTGYTDVLFDDTSLRVGSTDTYGANSSIFVQWPGGVKYRGLMAVKDLFTELPKTTDGKDITINSATLHITRYNQGSSSNTLYAYQVTTNWLFDDAGSNENDCCDDYAESSQSTTWASGDFSSSDYDAAVCCTTSWVNNYNEVCHFDITDVIQEIYTDEVNYGWVLTVDADVYISVRSSENGTLARCPSLEIVYSYGGSGEPPTTYTLTVNNGSGDGSYAENTVVGIDADSPASGQVFDVWVGDTAGIASLASSSTTITMPASNVEITGTYASATLYTLTVNSGSGDGSYQEDWVVNISADVAPSGQQFDEWAGDTAGIANLTSSSTTITMPAANAEITATYTDLGTTYTLVVNSGTGDGDYLPGTVINIAAASPPANKAFDQWTGDITNVDDIHDSTTTVTMPSANAEITATYADTYTLTVNSGTGGGDYVSGAVVNISANTPPAGKAFDNWVGDTTNVANVNAADTTVTMPTTAVEVTATYEDIGPGPSISSTSGTWSQGNSVTIYGSSFGSHADYQPTEDYLCLGWKDFEDGSLESGPWYIPESQYNSQNWAVMSTGGRANSSHHAKKYYNVSRLGGMAIRMLADYSEWYASYYLKVGTAESGGKIYRIYGDDHNIFLGTGDTNLMIRGNSSGEATQWSSPDSLVLGQWHRIEVWMDESPNEFKVYLDHTWQWTRTDWTIYPWGASGHTWEAAHMVSEGGEWHVDDIYFSPTRARVEIGNASTWSGCTTREVQIPTAWSNSTITIEANKGALSSFSGKYLYVVDSSGTVSAGYGL